MLAMALVTGCASIGPGGVHAANVPPPPDTGGCAVAQKATALRNGWKYDDFSRDKSRARVSRHLFDSEVERQILYRVFDRAALLPDQPARRVNSCRHQAFNDDEMCLWRPSSRGVGSTPWTGLGAQRFPAAMGGCADPARRAASAQALAGAGE